MRCTALCPTLSAFSIISLALVAATTLRADEAKRVPPRQGKSETIELFHGKDLP